MAPLPMRWLRPALAAAVVAMAASACRVDATVDVVVGDEGAGEVTVRVVVDAEAVRMAPDLPDSLRLADVAEAGWEIAGPETVGGDMTVEVSKEFDSAEQLPQILAELAGEGIFEDVTLARTHTPSDFRFSLSDPVSASRTSYVLTGRVVPPTDPAVFSDDSLIAVLGDPFGRPELVDEDGQPVDLGLALKMSLSFTLPNDLVSETATRVEGGKATWTFALGDAPFAIDALGAVENPVPRRWLAGAVAALVIFVLVVLLQLAWWIFNTLRTPKGRRRRATRRRATRRRRRQGDAVGSSDASPPRRRLLRLLVVDVHGVIVRPTEPLEGLLLPTILHEQPDISPDLIRDRHRKMMLGRLTPEEFWSDLGLGPVAEEIETRYLSSFRLVPGLHPFLDRMRERRLPVAAVGNQPRPWGERLRRMASLEDSVASWLVSGDVGATLPEPSLLEATRRTMSVDVYDCLYLSSVPEHLDAAAEVGMATAYFAASPADVLETSHTMVRGFSDILRGRAGST